MWFSGLRETKPFGAFSFFFLENDGCGLSGAMGDRGQQMGAAALPLALNQVEGKWACAIHVRVLERKDPSTERNRSRDAASAQCPPLVFWIFLFEDASQSS